MLIVRGRVGLVLDGGRWAVRFVFGGMKSYIWEPFDRSRGTVSWVVGVLEGFAIWDEVTMIYCSFFRYT